MKQILDLINHYPFIMTHSIVFDIVSYGLQNSILDIKKSEGKAVFSVCNSLVSMLWFAALLEIRVRESMQNGDFESEQTFTLQLSVSQWVLQRCHCVRLQEKCFHQ